MKKTKDKKTVDLPEKIKQELIQAARAVCGKSFLLNSGKVVTKYDAEWQGMTFCDKAEKTVAVCSYSDNKIVII